MKRIVFILTVLVSFTSFGQGFIDGHPRGSVWQSEGILTIKSLNTSEELGLWRTRLSEWSPTAEASTWIFADDFVVIEPPNPDEIDLPNIKLNYSYEKGTKTLKLSRMYSDTPDWIYDIGITSSGGFVLLMKKDDVGTSW